MLNIASSYTASKSLNSDSALFPEYNSVPSNVSINLSLAKLAAQANKPDVAAQRYLNALQSSWWCWEAYEGLCKIGQCVAIIRSNRIDPAPGKAPDAETCFADVTVPIVPDPPSGASNVQRLSPEQQFRGVADLDRAPSHRSFSRGRSRDPMNEFSTPAANGDIAPLPMRKRSQASTSTNEQNRPRRIGKSAITPNETQGAALRFSEALGVNGYAEPDTEMYDEISGPVNGAVGNGIDNDTTFFGVSAAGGAPRKHPQPTFGLPAMPVNGGARPTGAPLFGSGLLFGQHMPKAPAASFAARPSFGGSFFTPVQLKRDTNGSHLNGTHAGRSSATDRHQAANGEIKAEEAASPHAESAPNTRVGSATFDPPSVVGIDAGPGVKMNGKKKLETLRTIGNPRDRKRTRAGIGIEDAAASSSHSYDLEQPADHASYTSSSPPPARINGLNGNDERTHYKGDIQQRDEIAEREDAALSRSTAYRKQVNAAQRALAENWLRSMFRAFGKATQRMSRYKADDTLKSILLDLPAKQQNCSRALLLLARAHYENLSYAKVSGHRGVDTAK